MSGDRPSDQNRKASPGVRKLLCQDLIEEIWRIHSQRPDLLPSFFDLDRGRGTQKVSHFCLVPWYWRVHRIPCHSPVEGLRLALRKYDDGSLLLKIRNLGMEERLASGDSGCVQGQLFIDADPEKDTR